MNLSPETSFSLRPNHPSTTPIGFNLNSPQRPRLPAHVNEEILRASPSENSSSPSRQKLSLSSMLSSPSRLIQQLPASPASLLLNPLIRKNDQQQFPTTTSSLLNNDDETNLIEQIDHYFIRRQQYLQRNIDASLNTSKWILENVVFYSIETLRYDLVIKQIKKTENFSSLDVKLKFRANPLERISLHYQPFV